MTACTVPTTVLLLTLAGAAIIARRRPRSEASAQNGFALLAALCAVFPIALISLPSVPIFGGTKHWMPAMPFFALLAGVGAARLAGVLADRLARLPRSAVIAAALALLLAPPLQQTWTSHPFGLASYVPLVGGAPGAADMGMLRQFWGYTTAGVIPFLNGRVPQQGRVYFHDTAPQSVEMFREDGSLRPDIRNSKIAGSDFALVHHELHMILVDTYIWNEYGAVHPAHVLTYQGVPMVSVYENPKRR